MNVQVSSSKTEYTCKKCGKKSRFPSKLPHSGVFKVSCYYCKHVSEIKYEANSPHESKLEINEKVELFKPLGEEEEVLHPLKDMSDPSNINKNPNATVKMERYTQVNVQAVEQAKKEVISPQEPIEFEELDASAFYTATFKETEASLDPDAVIDFDDIEEVELQKNTKPNLEKKEVKVEERVRTNDTSQTEQIKKEEKSDNQSNLPADTSNQTRALDTRVVYVHSKNPVFRAFMSLLNIKKFQTQDEEYIPFFQKTKKKA